MITHLIGNALIVYSAAVGTASVVVYAKVPWWRNPMGRHLMAYMIAVALVLDLSTIRLTFGDSVWFQDLRLAVFLTIPVVMTWRLLLLWQAQREKE